MRHFLLVLLMMSLAGCTRDSADKLASVFDRESSSIVNGTREPQNTFLTENQILSIAFLADQSGDEFCTGTLVAPRIILSAEHCIDGVTASSLFIGFGMMPAERRALLPVAQIHAHPEVDFALIILGVDATEVIPEIEPIAMNRASLDETWIGRKVDASGYGETYNSATTGRFFASVEVVGVPLNVQGVGYEVVSVDGKGEQGICYGDSGGPILWQPDAETPPVIVGTEQWGDSSCVDVDHLTRVDVVADWVDSKIAEGLPPVLTACDEVVERYCDGDSVKGCDGTYDRSEDCVGGCGFMGPDAGYDCLPEICNGIDYFGECDGDLLRYCKGDRLRERDCAARGQTCVFEGEEVGYNCGDCQRCGGSECVDFETDTLHCGACGNDCSLPNAAVACGGGVCSFTGCVDGFEDADGDASNGCEASTGGNGSDGNGSDGNGGSGTKSGGDSSGCTQVPTGSLLALLGLLGLRRRRR